MRNSLLAHLTASKAAKWDLRELQLLLNADTTELDLEKWRSMPKYDYGYQIMRIFENITNEAPNLDKVSLGDEPFFVGNCPFYFCRYFIVDRLQQLKNLSYLNLNRACNLNSCQLIDITKNLKKLVCLKVKLLI